MDRFDVRGLPHYHLSSDRLAAAGLKEPSRKPCSDEEGRTRPESKGRFRCQAVFSDPVIQWSSADRRSAPGQRRQERLQ